MLDTKSKVFWVLSVIEFHSVNKETNLFIFLFIIHNGDLYLVCLGPNSRNIAISDNERSFPYTTEGQIIILGVGSLLLLILALGGVSLFMHRCKYKKYLCICIVQLNQEGTM